MDVSLVLQPITGGIIAEFQFIGECF